MRLSQLFSLFSLRYLHCAIFTYIVSSIYQAKLQTALMKTHTQRAKMKFGRLIVADWSARARMIVLDQADDTEKTLRKCASFSQRLNFHFLKQHFMAANKQYALQKSCYCPISVFKLILFFNSLGVEVDLWQNTKIYCHIFNHCFIQTHCKSSGLHSHAVRWPALCFFDRFYLKQFLCKWCCRSHTHHQCSLWRDSAIFKMMFCTSGFQGKQRNLFPQLINTQLRF